MKKSKRTKTMPWMDQAIAKSPMKRLPVMKQKGMALSGFEPPPKKSRKKGQK